MPDETPPSPAPNVEHEVALAGAHVLYWSIRWQQKKTQAAFHNAPYLVLSTRLGLCEEVDRKPARDALTLRIFDTLNGCIEAGNAYKPTPAMLEAGLKVPAENPDEMREAFAHTTHDLTIIRDWARSLTQANIDTAAAGFRDAKVYDKELKEGHQQGLKSPDALESIQEKLAVLDEILARPEPTVVQKQSFAKVEKTEAGAKIKKPARKPQHGITPAGMSFLAIQKKEQEADDRAEKRGRHHE